VAKGKKVDAGRATIIAAVIAAAALVTVAILNAKLNPSTPKSPSATATATSPTSGTPSNPPLSVVIDVPQERSAVGYPTRLSGHINGTMPSGSSIWGASVAGDRVFSQYTACRVEQHSFECGDIHLGDPQLQDHQETVCVYLVGNPAQFENYANRPNNSSDFPGFALDPQPVLDSDCNDVTRR
jgi:hypothetical protein